MQIAIEKYRLFHKQGPNSAQADSLLKMHKNCPKNYTIHSFSEKYKIQQQSMTSHPVQEKTLY